MTDIELLPLPEPDNDVAVDGEGNETLFEFFTDDQVLAYARANVAHATAAKDAEIERLRAEREVIGAEAVKYAEKSGRLEARAERLVEALREVAELAEAEGDALSVARSIARNVLRDHDQESGND